MRLGSDGGTASMGASGRDHRSVLRTSLRLGALPSGRGTRIDRSRRWRRADEADGAYVGVVDQRPRGFSATVHEAHDTWWQVERVEDLEEENGRQRRTLGCLQHERVPARDRIGEKPARDHQGKVERYDGGAHADRLANQHLVDAAGDVLAESTLRFAGAPHAISTPHRSGPATD
jgi:hypothetical protein